MGKGINTTVDEGQTPVIAQTLRGEGFDASEDGTGRQNLVPVAFAQNTRDEVRLLNGDGKISGALAAQPGMKQQTYIAFSSKDSGNDVMEDVSPTLRAMNHADSHPNGGGQVAVSLRGREGGSIAELRDDKACAQSASQGGGDKAHVLTSSVRRLTPRECERLQGFPDDYTAVPDAKGKPAADGPRYKALGNSWAVPNVRWIGRRIDIIDKILG